MFDGFEEGGGGAEAGDEGGVGGDVGEEVDGAGGGEGFVLELEFPGEEVEDGGEVEVGDDEGGAVGVGVGGAEGGGLLELEG